MWDARDPKDLPAEEPRHQHSAGGRTVGCDECRVLTEAREDREAEERIRRSQEE